MKENAVIEKEEIELRPVSLEDYRQVADHKPLELNDKATDQMNAFDRDDNDAANERPAANNIPVSIPTQYYITDKDLSAIGASQEQMQKFSGLENEEEKAEMFAQIALQNNRKWEFKISNRVPYWVRYDGNPTVIDQAFRNYGEHFTTADKANLLVRRSASLKAEKRMKDEAGEELSKGPKITLVEKDGVVKLEGFELPKLQSSNNGCWSCSMQIMLQSQGMGASQEEIRSYRPKLDAGDRERIFKPVEYENKITGKKFTDDSTELNNHRSAYDRDTGQVLTDHADAAIDLAPNHMLHETEIMKFDPGAGWENGITREQYYQKTEDYCRKQILHALKVDHSAVSVMLPGHYITVVGIDNKNNLIVKDSIHDMNKEEKIPLRSLIQRSMSSMAGFRLNWMSKVRLAPDGTSIYGIPSENTFMGEDGRIMNNSELERNGSMDVMNGTNINGRMIERKYGWSASFDAPEIYTDGGIIKNEKLYLPRKVNAQKLKEESKQMSAKEHRKLAQATEEMYGVKTGFVTDKTRYVQDLEKFRREEKKAQLEKNCKEILQKIEKSPMNLPKAKSSSVAAACDSLMQGYLHSEKNNKADELRKNFAYTAVILKYRQMGKNPPVGKKLDDERRQLYNQLVLDNYPVDFLRSCMESPEKVNQAVSHMAAEAYRIPKDKVAEYIEKMTIVADNMMPKENRSTEYQEFYDAVQKIAKLGKTKDNEGKPAVDSNELLQANALLMGKIKNYTQGKEKSRIGSDGRARFANALDAMSVLGAYGQEAIKNRVKDTVKNINKIRGAEKMASSDHLEIYRFGANRAAREAKRAQELKTKYAAEKAKAAARNNKKPVQPAP